MSDSVGDAEVSGSKLTKPEVPCKTQDSLSHLKNAKSFETEESKYGYYESTINNDTGSAAQLGGIKQEIVEENLDDGNSVKNLFKCNFQKQNILEDLLLGYIKTEKPDMHQTSLLGGDISNIFQNVDNMFNNINFPYIKIEGVSDHQLSNITLSKGICSNSQILHNEESDMREVIENKDILEQKGKIINYHDDQNTVVTQNKDQKLPESANNCEFTTQGSGSDRSFTCSECQYATPYKSRIKIHCLIHKDKSKIKMFNCDLCTYDTIYKAALQRHVLLRHEDSSKIKMFKCKICGYETKIKGNLTKHELIHKNVKDVELFSCTKCDYKTKFKQHMTTHLLIHKDTAEVTMFRCTFCDYEAKFKSSLINHLKTHKESSEVETFTCEQDSCDFKTKQKANYKRHLKLHEDKANLEQFSCSECEFTTHIQYKLKRHKKVHETPVEQRLKCALCEYQTRFESHLENHIEKTHNKSQFVHCEYCSFKTRCKTYLKKHIMVHEKPENRTISSCKMCDYKTDFSSNLARHCRVNHSTIH